MAQVLVRQLDAGVVERLKRKAAERGASLEAYARELLTWAAAEDRVSALARLDALRLRQPVQQTDSTNLLRRRRDGDGDGE